MTRKTQPGTNWRVFWQSTTLLSSSSKAPGKATGSVSDRTHVRSLARRKSKWTIGGCGALRRCGCARTYEGTQFLCVKFRLGSAGEPTICSHCYDVLNEVACLNHLHFWLWILLLLDSSNPTTWGHFLCLQWPPDGVLQDSVACSKYFPQPRLSPEMSENNSIEHSYMYIIISAMWTRHITCASQHSQWILNITEQHYHGGTRQEVSEAWSLIQWGHVFYHYGVRESRLGCK